MKFIDDWRRVWLKLWSVRLMLVSAALDAAEAVLPELSDSIPPGLFLVLSAATAVAALAARLIAQPNK